MGSGEWGVGSEKWDKNIIPIPHSLLPIPHSLLPISEIEQTQSRNLVEFAQPLRDEVADRLFINFPLHTLLIATQLAVGFFSQPTASCVAISKVWSGKF